MSIYDASRGVCEARDAAGDSGGQGVRVGVDRATGLRRGRGCWGFGL